MKRKGNNLTDCLSLFSMMDPSLKGTTTMANSVGWVTKCNRTATAMLACSKTGSNAATALTIGSITIRSTLENGWEDYPMEKACTSGKTSTKELSQMG